VKVAHVVFSNTGNYDPVSIPFHLIEWTPHHVIFYTNDHDKSEMLIYLANTVLSLHTETITNDKVHG
jgi:hypothetical protein